MATVALDLLGGDEAPTVVADAVALLSSDPAPVEVVLVGPRALARDLLEERGVDARSVPIIDAHGSVGMAQEPLSTLRAQPDSSVLVAARAVARGGAQAWVSVGHTGAAVAAAVLELGRLPGVARPALAVVIPALHGPVVLMDAGAAPDATPDLLRQFAVAGHAYAEALGVADPTVGLLTIGGEDGKGDRLRKSAHDLLCETLSSAGIRYSGAVEGHDLADGRAASVVVTDGFTGNVVLKALEGAVQWSAQVMGAAYPDPAPAWDVAVRTATSDFAGGMLLGVAGVTVVGHGAGSASEIAACVRLASRAADADLIPRLRAAFGNAS